MNETSSSLLLLVALAAACTTRDEPHPASVRSGAKVEAAAERTVEQPEPPKPEPPKPEPPQSAPQRSFEPGVRVHPKLSVTVTLDGGCNVDIHAEHLPAFNPDTLEVVTLQRSVAAFRQVGLLELVSYDLTTHTGVAVATLADETIAGEIEGDDPCVEVRRLAERGLASARDQLQTGTWEAMPPLPLRWLHDPVLWRERRDALQREHPKEVEAYVRHGQLVVRIPGVEVLERHEMGSKFEGNTVHRIWGHRPSGTVLLAEVLCVDEGDSHCGYESTHLLMSWLPKTLASIDRMPCSAETFGWDDCQIQSSYMPHICEGDGVCEPWDL